MTWTIKRDDFIVSTKKLSGLSCSTLFHILLLAIIYKPNYQAPITEHKLSLNLHFKPPQAAPTNKLSQAKNRANTLTKARLPKNSNHEPEESSSAPKLSNVVIRHKAELITPKLTPAYPLRAKLNKIEGIVRIRLTVDPEGKVSNAHIISGSNFALNESALNFVKQLNFLPQTNDQGEPVVGFIDHEVIFRLK